MHYAIVTNPERVEPAGAAATIVYNVVFGGGGLQGVDISFVFITLQPGDTPTALRSKISTAVMDEATRIGYHLQATDITLPAFQKGV